MSKPDKIVTLDAATRDEFRRLRRAVEDAEQDERRFRRFVKEKHSPATRTYAPFNEFVMEILDDGKSDSVAHIYFTERSCQ